MRPATLRVVLLLTALPATAPAQWAAMMRQDDTIKADLSSSVVVGSEDAVQGGLALHQDLSLQGGHRGWGGYLQVPFVAQPDAGALALGNVELGVLADIDLPLLSLTLPAGVATPTLTGDANVAAGILARITDLPHSVPESATLRVGSSLRLPAGVLRARIDAGFDVLFPLNSPDPAADLELFFRANVGLGGHYKLFAATLEYSLYAVAVDNNVSFARSTTIHSLALSLRLNTSWLQPYLAAHLPLTRSVLGDVGIITVGVTTSWDVTDSGALDWLRHPQP